MCVLRDVSQRRNSEEKIRVLNQRLERRSSELADGQPRAFREESGSGTGQPAEERIPGQHES